MSCEAALDIIAYATIFVANLAWALILPMQDFE